MEEPINFRSKAFVMVINNYTLEHEWKFKKLAEKSEYAIYGREFAPTTGTPHMQAYIRFKNARAKHTLQSVFKTGWIRRAGGDDFDNQVYSSKTNDYWEWKTPTFKNEQGKRNDIHNAVISLVNGTSTLEDIMMETPETFVRYNRGLEKVLDIKYNKKRTTRPFVEWRYGLSGQGKSFYVFNKYGFDDVYVKDNTRWWNNYEQQPVILMDDWDINSMPFRMLLNVIGENPYPCEYKGGYRQINSPKIYITCEYPPSHYWTGNELQQVLRRLSRLVEVIAFNDFEQPLC